MHIQRIEVASILGLDRADINLGTGVLLVAGPNGAGKSSLADAISMAFTGQPRRVSLKKELAQLIREGDQKGRVSVYLSDEGLAQFTLPKGEHDVSEIKGAEYLPYAIDASLFARQDEAERRKTLFKLTGCKASADVIQPMLEKRGIDMALWDLVKPMLRAGFPAASKDAKERATLAKGGWRNATGENWGSEKAEGWEMEIPEGPDVTAADLQKAEDELKKTATDIENGMKYLGTLQAEGKAKDADSKRLAELKEKAGQVKNIEAKKAVTEKDLASWQEKLITLRAELEFASAITGGCECPSCGTLLKIVGAQLELYKGAKEETRSASNLAIEAAQAQKTVDMLTRTLANDQKALAEAENAASTLEREHKASQGSADNTGKIAEAEEAIQELRKLKATQQAKLSALSDRYELINSKAEVERKAAELNRFVKSWLAISEALAPDGIPAELLGKALAPVNQAIGLLSGMAKWKVCEITEDIEITYGGRLYGLCSESERWRADTLISLAIATISGLRFALLDRFDVLDLPSRSQLLLMCCQLIKLGSMDTIIMCGTMKALPEKLPAPVTAVWVENHQIETART